MSFGDQVVALVAVTQSGTPGRLGVKPEARSVSRISGCHFRPMSIAEVAEIGYDVADEVWKLTAPPGVAADANDEVLFDGSAHPELLAEAAAHPHTFHVTSRSQPKSDLSGVVHHVTVMCKRQSS